MNYFLNWLSGFFGAISGVLLYTTYAQMKRAKILREIQSELIGKLETEMTFAQMAEHLRKEMDLD